jgi:hypothetical protein
MLPIIRDDMLASRPLVITAAMHQKEAEEYISGSICVTDYWNCSRPINGEQKMFELCACVIVWTSDTNIAE